MGAFVSVADLQVFEPDIDTVKAEAMIADSEAMAALVAPCITASDFPYGDAVKAILRGAILRWNDTGSGAVTQMSAGPFQQTIDTTNPRKSLFWPSEKTQLEDICKMVTGIGSSGAYSIDTAPTSGPAHRDVCALTFGATYCSCGADLTLGLPLWEGP